MAMASSGMRVTAATRPVPDIGRNPKWLGGADKKVADQKHMNLSCVLGDGFHANPKIPK